MIASGFKVGGNKGKCIATKAKFSLICTTADFEIVNRNQLKTKRRIVTIGNMTVPIKVSDGVQHTRKDFTIKVIEGLEDEGELVITTTDVATPENADKVIALTVNRSDVSGVSFAITGGADKAKFSLSGNTLTFAGSTKDTNHGADGLIFEKVSIADLDIGWGNIVQVLINTIGITANQGDTPNVGAVVAVGLLQYFD
jgi:hypothetical protein